MAKKPDFTQVAFRVFQKAVGLEQAASHEALSPKAAAGRKGGLLGGKSRASKLSAQRRREISKKAAKARWSKAKKKP